MGLLLLTASRFEADCLRGAPAHLPDPVVVGVGPLASALGAAAALGSTAQVSGCLLLGLAGTRHAERAPLETCVLGCDVLDEAVGAGHGEGFVPLASFGLPAAEGLPQRLALALPAAHPGDPQRAALPPHPLEAERGGSATRPRAGPALPWIVGTIGTVAAASADPSDAAGWRRRHPDVLVEEMEGYAVALACRRAGVPLAILRGVSNLAGDRNHANWRFGPAMDAVARAAPQLLSALGWT